MMTRFLLSLALLALTPACSDDDDDDADAGAVDAGDRDDWIARCEAAATEEDCAATQLPALDGCDDCWHTCAWYTMYAITTVAGGCSYGDPEGRCLYVAGGESGSDSLIRYCRRPNASDGAVFWIERDGALSFGFSSDGSVVNATRCEIDDHGQPVEGSPAECACPCLPGYPGAECEVVGGVERCNGVPAHRVDAAACAEGAECGNDADCAPDQACLCAHGNNDGERTTLCVTAECRTDADCAEGLVCAVSYESPRHPLCEPTTLACRAPYDFCDGVVCGPDDPCVYGSDDSSWSCQTGNCS